MPRPKKEQPNHAGGLYEVKITVGKTIDGKLIRKSFYSSTSKADARAQAEQYKIDREVASQTGAGFISKDITFADWSRKWLETYKKGKVKDNTYLGTYEIPVEKHLIPYFGNAPINNIRPIDIQNFFDSKAKSSAEESIKKMRACLKAIFDTAIENDLCGKNPVTASIKIKSSKPETEKQVYTQKEYDTVYTFAKSHPNGLDIMLMLETGVSRSELLGLRWEDIDSQNCAIYIRQGVVDQKDTELDKWVTVSDGLKNVHRERVIPLSKNLMEKILEKPRSFILPGNKRKHTPDHIVSTEYVFYSPQGLVYSPKNWYNRVYKPFMEDLIAKFPDIPKLNPHELRHTRATLWVERGVDLFTVAKLMGHADLDMLSKRYAHSNLLALKKALGL